LQFPSNLNADIRKKLPLTARQDFDQSSNPIVGLQICPKEWVKQPTRKYGTFPEPLFEHISGNPRFSTFISCIFYGDAIYTYIYYFSTTNQTNGLLLDFSKKKLFEKKMTKNFELKF
jgi:hypothetical protein